MATGVNGVTSEDVVAHVEVVDKLAPVYAMIQRHQIADLNVSYLMTVEREVSVSLKIVSVTHKIVLVRVPESCQNVLERILLPANIIIAEENTTVDTIGPGRIALACVKCALR